MNTRHLHSDDAPELVPPAELLRLRAAVVQPPSASARSRHLAAITAVARDRSSTPAARFASRSVRGAAAVVATLAITSGLAAAQVLPPPAQRIFSSVSDRFAPEPEAPPATVGDPGDLGDASSSSPTSGGGDDSSDAPVIASAPDESIDTTADAPVKAAPSTATATDETEPTEPDPTTTTTIPGPSGPGSPEDPIDPGTTDGGPTDPGTDGGPTDPGTTDGSDGTVGTTEVPTTEVPAEDPVSPTGGSD